MSSLFRSPVVLLSALSVLCVKTESLAQPTIEVTSTGVGIGTAAPGSPLHVVGSETTARGIFVDQVSNDNAAPLISLRKARGAVPTAVLASDVLGNIATAGYDGTVFAYTTMIRSTATENWTSSAHGSNLLFHTCPTGSTTMLEQMRIEANGNVGIGTTAPGAPLDVKGTYNTPLIRANYGDAHTAGIGIDGQGSHWGVAIFQDGTKRLNVDSTGGVMIGADYMSANGPDNGLIVQGNVGIGTTSPSYKLHVSGSVRATSFIADVNTYADHVFRPGYQLAALSEVEAHIQTKGHLPDIPSEADVKRDGLDMPAMQVKLLQKVEELTLYMIELKKENEALRQGHNELQRKLEQVASSE